MTKMIVETQGDYQLAGSLIDGSDRVLFDRPCVVQKTTYIELRVGAEISGLTVYADDLPDDASDEDFAATYAECDGDAEAAVEIYLTELNGIEDQESAEDRATRLADEKAKRAEKAAAKKAGSGKDGAFASDGAGPVPPAKDGVLTPNPSTDPELQK